MKRTQTLLLSVTALAATLVACNSLGPKPEATLDGIVSGIADSTKVYLFDTEYVKLDSTFVIDGNFHFDFAEAYPDQNLLLFEDSNRALSFIVEPGAITATVNNETQTAVFTGTPTNDIWEEYKTGVADINAKIDEIGQKRSALGSAGRGTPEYDSLSNLYAEALDALDLYTENVVRENYNTIFAARIVSTSPAFSMATSPEELELLIDSVANAPANAFTDRLRERREILVATAVGQPAPDFTQERPDGTPLSLSSLRGKLVLIDFWASWCGPCRAENPNVVRIYNQFKDKGFEILGVSLDGDREAWLKAIDDDGLSWLHVSDLKAWSNDVARQYGVRMVPQTVLVDPDGIIVAKNLRGEELETKIAELTAGVK